MAVNGKERDGGVRRILLCRPRGGLNDTLCQIQVCRRYAARWKRRLWVDTSKSGFLECLSEYFLPFPMIEFGIPEDTDEMSCFPTCVQGRVSHYQARYEEAVQAVIESSTGVPLSFDFGRDYPVELLVHEQFGGGLDGGLLLRKMRLERQLAREIRGRIEGLGDYQSVHVRHSDMKTDYRAYFARLKRQVGNSRLLLCTDSYACQRYALDFFPNLSLSWPIPDCSGKPLHGNPLLDRKLVNQQTLTDLMLLAAGRSLHFTKTECGSVSGFVRLAISLRARRLWQRRLGYWLGEPQWLIERRPTFDAIPCLVA